MEVRPKGVLVDNALRLIFAIIAVTLEHLTKGPFTFAQEGHPVVVFKTIVGLVGFGVLNGYITNKAIVILTERVMI